MQVDLNGASGTTGPDSGFSIDEEGDTQSNDLKDEVARLPFPRYINLNGACTTPG